MAVTSADAAQTSAVARAIPLPTWPPSHFDRCVTTRTYRRGENDGLVCEYLKLYIDGQWAEANIGNDMIIVGFGSQSGAG